jgi:hypothetical protein
MKAQQLTIPQLKSRLVQTANRSEKLMAPMLFFLRKKLKAQGKAGQGFGLWVEENLQITRRTADRWANEWGIVNEKMKRPSKRTSGQHDQKSRKDAESGPPKVTFNLPLLLNDGEHEVFMWAVETIGEDEVARLVFKTVTEKAKELQGPRPADPFQLPPKRPAASSANGTIFEDLEAKQQPAGRV